SGCGREAAFRKEPDVERGQREFLTAPRTGPAESLRDGDVDRQGAHVGGDVAAHGRMISREPAPVMWMHTAPASPRCAGRSCFCCPGVGMNSGAGRLSLTVVVLAVLVPARADGR